MTRKNLKKTQEKVTKVFNQAKDSLRVLEILEKEAVAKARSFVKVPNMAEGKRLTNERILKSLTALGLATQDEVNSLRKRVEVLEAELAAKKSRSSAKAASASASANEASANA